MKYSQKTIAVQLAFTALLQLCLQGCATYRPQQSPSAATSPERESAISHTFYLAGGLGTLKEEDSSDALAALEAHLIDAPKNSTLIFTGDNISGKEGTWNRDKKGIARLMDLTKNFKGQTIFIPGDFEWKERNSDDMERVEEFIKDSKRENTHFFPENACPLERMEINDQLDLILIDSEWFIANWDKVEGINKKCTNIVTRLRFAEELEGLINDGQDKNIVIAMHHPIFSNGKYAGKDTFGSHMLPLPVVGSIVNRIGDWGGFSDRDLYSRRYNYLRILVSSLARKSDRITLVSGHEQSLQYLEGGDIHQVVSGSLGEATATHLSDDVIIAVGGTLPYSGVYTHGARGFAKLEYYKDGASKVSFISTDPQVGPASFEILPALPNTGNAPKAIANSEQYIKTSVLEDEKDLDLDRTGFYTFLWGDRYRSYFGKQITAKTVQLDTLYGGLKVSKQGGGHQSSSLRLEDGNGKEFAMRSLKKNALKYLKSQIMGISYEADDYKGTWTEEIVADFFTTAHPYIQLVISPMAREVDVNHASPELFYVPRQESLGALNEEYGDQLYFIEERPSDEQKNYTGFSQADPNLPGKVPDFESTTDMLEQIKGDESDYVDERAYVRARIFDMLIGDWDRHQDQWRWVQYEPANGDKRFIPVPRDRDGAFAKFDGFAMPIIKWFVPTTRFWQSYGPEPDNVKWLNAQGNSLDRALVTEHGADIWTEEAKFIQEHLTMETIDRAFLRLPKEVRDSTAAKIKSDLVLRLKNLREMATEYGNYLNKVVALTGTEKDDLIEVTRLPNGETKVVIKRLLSDQKNEVVLERTLNRQRTKEIWLYGLGDDDQFVVDGQGDHEIFIRIIGGYGEDSYKVENTKALKIYDWKWEDSHFEESEPAKQLSNIYTTNTYHWRYFKENTNILVPNAGFRTDDGLFLGVTNVYTNNGFNGNPFRQQHSINANYYFRFQGVELDYKGIFANIFPKWNFEVDGYFTNDRFSNNYFGEGNETDNPDGELGRDFNRARMRQVKLKAGLAYRTLKIKALYESFKIAEGGGRYFVPENVDSQVFQSQDYVGSEVSLYYYDDDADDFPTKGLYVGFTGGYKANLGLKDNSFGYLALKFGFNQKLVPSGNLVLGSNAEYRTNLGDEYFFYHAPSIGGDNGLRGFRNERFTGDAYFYQSSDLRLRLKKYITAVAPVTVGLYGGFDYGRVWLDGEDSNKWHTSQGGGLWISGYRFLAFNIGYFNSVDGNMVQVGFGFGF
tara:strand:+ start:25865 stop:29593 length:3729 start_codon:yes stop_codon:yes gene_type:complete